DGFSQENGNRLESVVTEFGAGAACQVLSRRNNCVIGEDWPPIFPWRVRGYVAERARAFDHQFANQKIRSARNSMIVSKPIAAVQGADAELDVAAESAWAQQ